VGLTLCDRDNTVDWLASNGDGAPKNWAFARKQWRKGSGRRSIKAERRIKGEAKAPEREA
jgi:hypothetical protein